MSKMFVAKVRLKDSGEDFIPVTWGGLSHYSNNVLLSDLVAQMEQYFPKNEYIIEEYEL